MSVLKWLKSNQAKNLGKRSCTLHDVSLTASIKNVIEVFFLGLKNSVSTRVLEIKNNTFIIIKSVNKKRQILVITYNQPILLQNYQIIAGRGD